jgi:hypothetical protein
MASTITALDTPTDVSLGTTTLEVNLPTDARLWSISCSADVLWYPTGTDGGAVNANAETLDLSPGAIIEINVPGSVGRARNLDGGKVYLAVASGSATATITARRG